MVKELISGVILVVFLPFCFYSELVCHTVSISEGDQYDIELLNSPKGILVLCFAKSQSKHSHINVYLFTFRSKSSHLSVNKVKSDQCPQFLLSSVP